MSVAILSPRTSYGVLLDAIIDVISNISFSARKFVVAHFMLPRQSVQLMVLGRFAAGLVSGTRHPARSPGRKDGTFEFMMVSGRLE